MAANVLIVHGWSDNSESFFALRDWLISKGQKATNLHLVDYITLLDDVRARDVPRRMDVVVKQKIAAKELEVPFDMIVHSTGGLVAREWIATLTERGETPPVKR